MCVQTYLALAKLPVDGFPKEDPRKGFKVDLGLAREDCQHAVTDESLCTVTGCALGTDVCHWMFKTKVNMVKGQEDGPFNH